MFRTDLIAAAAATMIATAATPVVALTVEAAEIVAVAPALAEAIRRTHDGESVSVLFEQ